MNDDCIPNSEAPFELIQPKTKGITAGSPKTRPFNFVPSCAVGHVRSSNNNTIIHHHWTRCVIPHDTKHDNAAMKPERRGEERRKVTSRVLLTTLYAFSASCRVLAKWKLASFSPLTNTLNPSLLGWTGPGCVRHTTSPGNRSQAGYCSGNSSKKQISNFWSIVFSSLNS